MTHECKPPESTDDGRWVCYCGERWFTGLTGGYETLPVGGHECTLPVGFPGRQHTCVNCGKRWFANSTARGTYEWRSI